MPCHHNLETYLAAYIEGAGIADDPKGPLFRTIGRGTGLLARTPLPQRNAYAMVGRDRLRFQGNPTHKASSHPYFHRSMVPDQRSCDDVSHTVRTAITIACGT
jgi:hypothetical protein